MSPNHSHFLFPPGPASYPCDLTKTHQVHFLFPMYLSDQLFKDNLDLYHPPFQKPTAVQGYTSASLPYFLRILFNCLLPNCLFFFFRIRERLSQKASISLILRLRCESGVIDTSATEASLYIADSSCMSHRCPHSLWWHHGPWTS